MSTDACVHIFKFLQEKYL